MAMSDTDPIREEVALQLDEAEILARLDDDRQLLADLCDMSLVELPGMVEPLVQAVQAEDAHALHRAAHRLKGSLSVFGEGPHVQDCEVMEEMALRNDLSETSEILVRLEKHLEQFRTAIAALGKETHARTDCR
jgi:HPt (histidine-containing phosphotransfer) domain-containing protein